MKTIELINAGKLLADYVERNDDNHTYLGENPLLGDTPLGKAVQLFKTIKDGNQEECFFAWLEKNQNGSLEENHPVLFFNRNEKAERTETPPDFLQEKGIGKMDRLPFIGECFYGSVGQEIQNSRSFRLVLEYRNVDQTHLLLIVNNEAYGLQQYNKTELIAAIRASGIDPQTCHFPEFNSGLEPLFTPE